MTIEGDTRPLERPFLVLATQNPIEYEGTYPLPEAQLDRFLLRIAVGYPTRDDEMGACSRGASSGAPTRSRSRPVVDAGDAASAMQRRARAGPRRRSVGRYMVDLVAATRAAPALQVGASPRGTPRDLLKLARARAALDGRDFVTPDDVKAVAVPALAHRLTLRPELWVQRIRGEDVVARGARRPCRRRPRRSPEPRRDAAARRLRVARRARPARGARTGPAGARRARGAVSPPARGRLPLRGRSRPTHVGTGSRPDPGAPGRTVELEVELETERRIARAEVLLCCCRRGPGPRQPGRGAGERARLLCR